MTEAEIKALTDEGLAEILDSHRLFLYRVEEWGIYRIFPYRVEEWDIYGQAKAEAEHRSALSASQRAARGEQPLPFEEAP